MILRRSFYLLAFCTLLTSAVSAQVVRFDTSVGDFDMVLNPTNNPLLQEHVDNLLHYVDDKFYDGSWINRAAEGFVLQMGSFYSNTRRPPATMDSIRSVATINPVLGEPASTISGLSNTVGTVAMALPGGANGTNQDGGTSSFFVNLGDNSFLDADFTVFAAISDLTVVNQIMDLMQIDRTTEDEFSSGSLAFSDVPLQDNGQQVFIKRAFVISDTLAITRANAMIQPFMAQSLAGGAGSSSAAPGSASAVVPEPASLLLLFVGLSGLTIVARRRR